MGTYQAVILLSLMVKARKLSESNPDPYTFNVKLLVFGYLLYPRSGKYGRKED